MSRKPAFAVTVAAIAATAALALLSMGGDAAEPQPTAKAAKNLSLAVIGKTVSMSGRDEKTRFTVLCPGRNIPLGGGMRADPPPGPGGEGVYPHSYERLGEQGGWHITPVLFSPSGQPEPRRVTLQVVCRRQVASVKRRRQIISVRPGEVASAVATCPGPRYLIGGGFQRTNFVSRGGNFVTESRAISGKSWRVTGSAFGGFGGELVSIVYCHRTNRPRVKAVSESTTVKPGTLGAVSTRRCPRGRRLIFGGFSTSPAGLALYADGFFKSDRWSVSAFNYLGEENVTLTAYGYCARLGELGDRKARRP